MNDTNHGRTHYAECWRDPAHHDCAVERCTDLLERIVAVKEKWKWSIRHGPDHELAEFLQDAVNFGHEAESILIAIHAATSTARQREPAVPEPPK